MISVSNACCVCVQIVRVDSEPRDDTCLHFAWPVYHRSTLSLFILTRMYPVRFIQYDNFSCFCIIYLSRVSNLRRRRKVGAHLSFPALRARISVSCVRRPESPPIKKEKKNNRCEANSYYAVGFICSPLKNTFISVRLRDDEL